MGNYITVERIRAEDLFVTKEFKQSKWAQKIYGGLEIFVTKDELVPGHFGTWFGAMSVREYQPNPKKYIDHLYVQDCYHLHECVHYRTWLRNPRGYHDWSANIVDSETDASLVSECEVYLLIPGLRKKTFPHPIWVDRFLKKLPVYAATDAVNELRAEIRDERLRALHAPRNNDYIEHQIQNFGNQNVQWCRIWAEPVTYGCYADVPAFRVVDRHLRRNPSLAQHNEWLEAVSRIATGHEHLKPQPFARQALEFLPYYERTMREFGNHVLTA